MTDPTALTAALRAGLVGHHDALLQAPTGAGKSTLVPLTLLEGARAGGKILMLEPRRLAARAVAARMAALRGERVGDTVGYRMRLDTRVSAATRIEVITEGVLTRLLQRDPALEGVDWLLFDEYHERSLQADLGLALALDARRQLGAGFRILIMSATLEVERVAALLTHAAVIRAGERPYAVQIRYLGQGQPLLPASGGPGAHAEWLSAARAAARAARRGLEDTAGDVLVFLPGAAEIRAAQAQLEQAGVAKDVQLLTLHGEMPGDAQDAVLAPAAAGRRKVVLATNVAETSLTIPGVTAVVDGGLVRRPRFDPRTGMGRLELARISRASADQRAGRAGRTATGVCYRLWSEGAHPSLAAVTPPEILDADLAALALELACWGSAAEELRWLDAPPLAAMAQARAQLRLLGALDAQGRLSAHGRLMAQLPVHPRLAHMLLVARGLGGLTLAAELAALLSERDLLREPDPDIRTRLELLEHRAPGWGVERLRQSARRLSSLTLALPSAGATEASAATPERSPAAVSSPGELLAVAFPDRIGQRREGTEGRYLLMNGRGAAFASPASVAREAWIVAVAVEDREREARIELAAPVQRSALEALFATQIRTDEQFGWDERSEAVLARRVRRLGALLLEERVDAAAAEDPRTLPALLQVLQRLGIESLPWDAESRGLQARMELVRSLGRTDLATWPASDDTSLLDSLAGWLAPYLTGVTRRAQLAQLPLREALLARLTVAQRRALERLAPREIVVPSGAAHRVDYLRAGGPTLAVRLQELFGLPEGPRIGDGTMAVTLELLSPARRPVQVTSDLGGFWRGSYATVRRDLRGRYPKHDWPEDPLRAVPTRRARSPNPDRSVPRRR